MTSTREEALQALAAKGQAEHNLAHLPLCPPERHAAFAALMATLVVTPAIPIPYRFVALVALFIAIPLIIQWDKRRLGVFINGYRRGKTRMVTFPMLLIILALYTASYYVAYMRHQPMLCYALAAITFVFAWFASSIWQRVFVSELSA